MDKALRVFGLIALAEAIIFMTVTMVAMIVLSVGLANALSNDPVVPADPVIDAPYCPTEDSCVSEYFGDAWHITEVTP